MSSISYRDTSSTSLLSGFIAIILSVLATLLVNWNGNIPKTPGGLFTRHLTVSQLIFAAAFAVLWQFCGTAFNLHRGGQATRLETMGNVLKCSGIMTVLLWFYLVASRQKVSFARILVLFLCCAVAFDLVRALSSYMSRRTHRVLIVGSDRLAAKAWREFRTHRRHETELAGFVDETFNEEMPPDIASRYLGDIENLPRIVLEHRVEDIVVAIPAGRYSTETERAITLAGTMGSRILCLKDMCGIHPENIAKDYGDVFFELVPAPRLRGIAQVAKRMFDAVISILVLSMGIFILLAAALLAMVRRETIGFEAKDLVGMRRKPFRSYRMCAGWLAPRFRFWVSHLPQWWNILRGEMSIVGPAPLSAEDLSNLDTALLAGRFNVRPGLTGYLDTERVTGSEGGIQRANEWSLGTDLKILARTFRVAMARTRIAERSAGAL